MKKKQKRKTHGDGQQFGDCQGERDAGGSGGRYRGINGEERRLDLGW